MKETGQQDLPIPHCSITELTLGEGQQTMTLLQLKMEGIFILISVWAYDRTDPKEN